MISVTPPSVFIVCPLLWVKHSGMLTLWTCIYYGVLSVKIHDKDKQIPRFIIFLFQMQGPRSSCMEKKTADTMLMIPSLYFLLEEILHQGYTYFNDYDPIVEVNIFSIYSVAGQAIFFRTRISFFSLRYIRILLY